MSSLWLCVRKISTPTVAPSYRFFRMNFSRIAESLSSVCVSIRIFQFSRVLHRNQLVRRQTTFSYKPNRLCREREIHLLGFFFLLYLVCDPCIVRPFISSVSKTKTRNNYNFFVEKRRTFENNLKIDTAPIAFWLLARPNSNLCVACACVRFF